MCATDMHSLIKGNLLACLLACLLIGHIGDDFYGSDDPTNSDKALKDNSWSVHQVKGQSHQAKPSTR